MIYTRLFSSGHLRAEIWMHTSGAFALQQKSPYLYPNLLKVVFDKDIGTLKEHFSFKLQEIIFILCF